MQTKLKASVRVSCEVVIDVCQYRGDVSYDATYKHACDEGAAVLAKLLKPNNGVLIGIPKIHSVVVTNA